MKTAYASCITGPKQHMVIDFWRLMWQERLPTIVMVTNLKEGSKKKCEQYWPESGSTTFGPFKVTLTEQQAFPNYCIRTLQVTVRSKMPDLNTLSDTAMPPCMYVAAG